MSRTRVLVATRNEHKLAEIRDILDAAPVDFVGLDEAGIPETEAEEDLECFETFRENAQAKARFFHQRSGIPTVADDSGLCVAALNGAPGVRTRRFAPPSLVERLGQDAANNQYLLERLEGVPLDRREAHYQCAIAAVGPDGELVVQGRVEGLIWTETRGEGGFGYDPIFLLPEYQQTYAELPGEVKRRTSHRAAALRKLSSWLGQQAGSRPAAGRDGPGRD
jgi:XTP/dITP diphosphohydrolase